MVSKGAVLLLFHLLKGASADWTTSIKANLTVANGFTPVIDFTAAPPPGASSLSSAPPSSFSGKQIHREQFTTTITVPDGMMPVIHYSAILSTHSASSNVGPPPDTASPRGTQPASKPPASSTPGNRPSLSSTPLVTPGRSSVSNPSSPVNTPKSSAPGQSGISTSGKQPNSIPLAPSSGRSSSSSGHSGSSTSNPASPGQNGSYSKTPTSRPASSPSSSSGPSRPLQSDSSSTGPRAPGGSLTTAPPSSGQSQSTPKATSTPGSSPADSSSSSRGPSFQSSSADLSSAPDIISLTPTGSASAAQSAILEFGPTGPPSSEPWGTLTAAPSSTITGTAANSEATDIAIFLKRFYNNIDQLKTDPDNYKKNLEDVEDKSRDYLSKIGYPSTKSPCSGSGFLKKRSLFGAIGNIASSAANVAKGAIDTAKEIAEDAISCIEPIADSMIKTIPDDVSGLTDEIENTVKKGSEYLDEISNIVTDMENKIKDDEDDNSSSESESSTSSSSPTSTCSSSTTFSDCTTTTILISTYSTGGDGLTSPSTSTTSTVTCTTETACNASPTSMTTTTTSVGSCQVRQTTRIVPSKTRAPLSVPYIPITSGSVESASPGSTVIVSTAPTSSRITESSVPQNSQLSSSAPGTCTSNTCSPSASTSSPSNTSSPETTSTPNQTTTPNPASTPSPTTTSPPLSYYMCLNKGGPEVTSPYCECSTLTEGQTYWATASLISGQCYQYTSFPSKITLTPSFTPTSPTATPVPFITTEANGEILSYPSQIFENFATEGAGTPVTLQTPSPSQTSGNDKGSGQCHSIDDACDRAYEQYVDDTVYSSYTSYTANIESGIIMAATFGQAGCAAMFTCDNDDYGFGMTGRQIKAAVEYMKENDSVDKCGTTYLSNSCHITLNYCTSCKATQ